MNTTPAELSLTCARLRAARDRVMPHRSVDTIGAVLAAAAAGWLPSISPWRTRAIAVAPSATGFSASMLQEIIDLTFRPITVAALAELARQEDRSRPRSLICHILAGNVPSPGILSICRGLLAQSANLVKTAERDPVFPLLFIESLRAVDAALADCVSVCHWRRSGTTLTQTALQEADHVIAYGDDQTIRTLTNSLPDGKTFEGHGHKLSFGVVCREALIPSMLSSLAAAAAFDVSVYDQQGCQSPHLFYVEKNGAVSPMAFAAALAGAMGDYAARVPRGPLSAEEAEAIARLRFTYEFRAATNPRVAIWSSPGSTEWTVIHDDDPTFTPSCLNRMIYVKPVHGLADLPRFAHNWSGRIATVGVTPLTACAPVLAKEFEALGARRICAIGEMQRPPFGTIV